MLNFIDKKGEKVMEVKDNGETIILNEALKQSFDEKKSLKEKEEEKKEDE